ncbi:MAG TPA: DHHA1 domain-containing protein, partial [Candidatus Paceibacterota bacterium]
GNIADEYERPVFLWGREGNMRLKGSMRSIDGVHGLELMRAAVDTFEDCGGHAAAGGFTVRDDAIFYLEDRLIEAYEKLEHGAGDAFADHADMEITPEETTIAFLKKVERLAPFGIANPKPVFLLRNVSVHEISRFGKSDEHLKIKIISDSGASIEAVMFFVKGSIARVADALTKESRVNLIGHIERDMFSRGTPVRIRLLNLRSA